MTSEKFELKEYSIRNFFEGNVTCILPDYQRRFVWLEGKQDELISSIKKGWPVGNLILQKKSDFEHLIIDGQQRLSSVISFLNNPISHVGYKNIVNDLELRGEKGRDYLLTAHVDKLGHIYISNDFLDEFEKIKLYLKDEVLHHFFCDDWFSKAFDDCIEKGVKEYQRHFGKPQKRIEVLTQYPSSEAFKNSLKSKYEMSFPELFPAQKEKLLNEAYDAVDNFFGCLRSEINIWNYKFPCTICFPNEYITSVFERINRTPEPLTAVELAAALWAGKNIRVANISKFTIDCIKEGLERQKFQFQSHVNSDSVHPQLGEFLYGITQRILKEYSNIFQAKNSKSKDKDKNIILSGSEDIGYYLLCMLMKLEFSKVDQLADKLAKYSPVYEEHEGAYILDASPIEEAIFFGIEMFKKSILSVTQIRFSKTEDTVENYGNNSMKLSMVVNIINSRYDVFNAFQKREFDEVPIEQLCRSIRGRFLYEVLSKDWAGAVGPNKTLDRCWQGTIAIANGDAVPKPYYYYKDPLDFSEIRDQVSNWMQENIYNPDTLSKNPPHFAKLIVKYAVAKRISIAVGSSCSAELDHVFPKSLLSSLQPKISNSSYNIGRFIPVHHPANLWPILKSSNRSKMNKTPSVYLDGLKEEENNLKSRSELTVKQKNRLNKISVEIKDLQNSLNTLSIPLEKTKFTNAEIKSWDSPDVFLDILWEGEEIMFQNINHYLASD